MTREERACTCEGPHIDALLSQSRLFCFQGKDAMKDGLHRGICHIITGDHHAAVAQAQRRCKTEQHAP